VDSLSRISGMFSRSVQLTIGPNSLKLLALDLKWLNENLRMESIIHSY